MKKIGIDIRLTNNQRGIASYITNLLINYQGLISDSNIEVYLMSDRTPTNEIKKLNFKTIILPIKIYPLWDFIIPFILFFYKIDLFHSPGNSTPFYKFGKLKYIVTIHDLIFYNTKFSGNLYQKIGRAYLKFNVWFNISRVNKIISVSNSTKLDIRKRFNLPESKISVVYESCHSEFFSKSKKDFSSLSNFICFGSDDPRKNTEFLLKTFDTFFSINTNFYLDVVGLPEKYIHDLKIKLRLKNERNFIFHSHISRDQLVFIYENSIALVYPSLYEGFGVPIIEAFKTSTPVITSSVSSLPEIAGEAGIFIDPYSTSDLLKALHFITVKENFELFCLKSKLRSIDFNWELFSKQTLAIYHEEI